VGWVATSQRGRRTCRSVRRVEVKVKVKVKVEATAEVGGEVEPAGTNKDDTNRAGRGTAVQCRLSEAAL
jgi:hypothetical protein